MPGKNKIKKQKVETALGWYEKACGFDRKGLEKKAETCYAKVYELGWRGLPEKERAGFFVGYGSTLRNNKKLKLSTEILREGVKRFPSYPALKIFLALTLHSRGQFKEAANVLFKSCLEMPEKAYDGYDRAIKFYIPRLKR